MDNVEKMAADIAERLNGGEWENGKWYTEGHRVAWMVAVKPYADEIERLREENAALLRSADDVYKRLMPEIEQLREALKHCVNALAEYEKELDPPPRRKQPADLTPFLLGALDNARSALQQRRKTDDT